MLEKKIIELLEQISIQLREIALTQEMIREEIGALKVEFELDQKTSENFLPILMN